MYDDVIRERVTVRGPRGALSGELAYGVGRPTHACVVMNPHPHMGGSFENPLVAAVAHAGAASGAVGLRFDYAGVGVSDGIAVDVAASMAAFWDTGCAPEDPAMVADAAAAVRWMRHTAAPGLPLALVGYSFGAFVAAECLADARPAALVLISPTLDRHDFTSLLRRDADLPPMMVVYADDDFATPVARTQAFLGELPPDLVVPHRVPGGEHFFRGKEAHVARVVARFLSAATRGPVRNVQAEEVVA